MLASACASRAPVPIKPAPPELELRSVMPAFWQWWATVEHASVDQQADGFWTTFVPAHPTLYSTSVMGKSFGDAPAARRTIHAFFENLPGELADMRSISDRMPALLRDGYARFSATFPDVTWRGPVYIMPSLFNFDGGTREIEQAAPPAGAASPGPAVDARTQLIFAPDGIARYHKADRKPDGQCAFFAHEFFHIYHQQFLATDGEMSVWQVLWAEGLATYVGAQLCPHATPAEVFVSATLASDVQPMLSKAATELRGQLDATDDPIVSRWFSMGTHDDVPSRAGYYVGYLLAQRAARSYTLPQLARLDPLTIRTLISTGLDELARAPR